VKSNAVLAPCVDVGLCDTRSLVFATNRKHVS
jgi:hypothetical protein